MTEDEILKKITRLLEKGCTMLATHHECGAPLFRCQGQVVCPVCSFPDDKSSDNTKPLEKGSIQDKSLESESPASPIVAHTSIASNDQIEESDITIAKQHLQEVLLKKLIAITQDVQTEQDLDKLKKMLICLETILSTLKSLAEVGR